MVWSNPDVAIPNGIPTMSTASNLVYGIGARDGVWTLEGLDWDTGEVVLTVETTASPTTNSFYAATTVGPHGSVWTGTFGGVTRFRPCDPDRQADCGRRLDPVEAVVGTVPADPRRALRDTLGRPNDDPRDVEDPEVDRDEPSDEAGDAGTSGTPGDDRPLPATGGGAGLAGLVVLLAGSATVQGSRSSRSTNP